MLQFENVSTFYGKIQARLAHGASTVLVIVVVFEVLWAVAQLMPVRRTEN